MIKLGGYDFDLPTLNKKPKFGYVTEYDEYKAISGKFHRTVRGKRFKAELSYSYLTDVLLEKLMYFSSNGYAYQVEITIPEGTFAGSAYIEVEDTLTRYAYINEKWVWTDIKVKLIGEELI